MRGLIGIGFALLVMSCGAATSTSTGAVGPNDEATDPDGTETEPTLGVDDVPEIALEFLRSIDELPFPSLEGRQVIRVHTGRRFLGRDTHRDEIISGVLIHEELFAFTVVHDLSPVTYRRGDSGYGSEVRYEPASWTEVLEHSINTARARVDAQSEDEMPLRSFMDERTGPRLRTALQARAALSNGYEREARELLALSLRMMGPSMPLEGDDGPVSSLRGDLAIHLFALTTDAYRDDDVERPELRTQLQSLVERFEGTEAAILSQYYIGVLGNMITEDEAQDRRRNSPSRIDELIYRLRDDRDAEIDIERMGLQVTPSLIPLLEDSRVTRQVHCDGRYIRWETYGEVAWMLLRRLSGERFSTAEQAERWWDEVQQVGEIEMLVRRIRDGDYLALNALEQLLARDQARAVQEGMAVARTAEERLRSSMIRILATAGPALPNRFLLEQVRSGPLSARLEAAEALNQRGNSQWIDPMVEQVRTYLEAHPEGGEGFDGMIVLNVLELLVEQGGDQGVSALRELYPGLRRQYRFELLMVASQVHTGDTDTSTRVNSLLINALDDNEILRVPLSLRRSGSECLFIGDAAAFILARRLSEAFDCTDPPYVRARRRVELANQWRASRGETPLAVPQPPPIPQVDSAEVETALRQLRSANEESEIEAAVAALLALGPGAADRTGVTARGLPSHHPARERAVAAAAQLASTVSQLMINDQELPIANRSELEQLRGRALTSETLPRLLVDLIASGPHGEISLSIHRDGEGRGVLLSITSRPATERAFLRSEVELFYAIRRGDGEVVDDVNYLEIVESLGRRGYTEMAESIGEVLDAPPGLDGEMLIVFNWSH